MNRLLSYICLVLSFFMTSCSDKEEGYDNRVIMMSASVNEVQVSTKAKEAQPYEGSDPAVHSLASDLCFSLTSWDYSVNQPTDNLTYIPCHTPMTFTTTNITPVLYNGEADKALKYPTSGVPVYCVGLYPQNTWSWDTNTFKAAIDGEKDLMFAPEISGTWNAQLGTTDETCQKFKHLLTWIKVVICATSPEATKAWGDVEQISVSTATTATVKDNSGTTDYEGTQDIQIMKDTHTLSILSHEAGSIFCAPSDKITLTVDTSKRKGQKVEMTVTNGFKAGNQYVIVLYFNTLSVIDGHCTLVPWENQNDNLYSN